MKKITKKADKERHSVMDLMEIAANQFEAIINNTSSINETMIVIDTIRRLAETYAIK